jgi:hypothetical protein
VKVLARPSIGYLKFFVHGISLPVRVQEGKVCETVAGCVGSWFRTLAPDHPCDEDLSLEIPERCKDEARKGMG